MAAPSDLSDPTQRHEPLIVTIFGVLLVGTLAHLVPFYPVPVSAAVAFAFSLAATRAPFADLGIRWPERPLRLLLLARC
ncbi:MAG TPA: hypothetical protein VK993_13980 [Chthoniobacterales bacterium]|nr:hypothetical protein [Chthoniobacterales bacterium]